MLTNSILNEKETDDFFEDVNSLISSLMKIIMFSEEGFELISFSNRSLSLFIRDLLPILDREKYILLIGNYIEFFFFINKGLILF
jgi:hypothetical protein